MFFFVMSSKHVFDRMKVLYVGYIGVLEGANAQPLYKYGITRNLYQRFMQHEKSFPCFHPRLVYPSLHHDIAEHLFTKKLRDLGLHRTQSIKNRHHRELFVTSPSFTLLDAHNLLLNLIAKAEQDYPIWMTK